MGLMALEFIGQSHIVALWRSSKLREIIGHFQEQQKRQLLDIVAIRQTVLTQDIEVIPMLLDNLLGVVGRAALSIWFLQENRSGHNNQIPTCSCEHSIAYGSSAW
jgi:hypothetical protein